MNGNDDDLTTQEALMKTFYIDILKHVMEDMPVVCGMTK